MDFASVEETVQTSHPLHAALVGAGTWAVTGDARVGVLAGASALVYMLVWGHRLPWSEEETAAPRSRDDPPAVIIPHDWRAIR